MSRTILFRANATNKLEYFLRLLSIDSPCPYVVYLANIRKDKTTRTNIG
ncbi:MAG: hypothetical protein ACK5EO_02960 [Planctomycetota bacterium]